MTVVFGGNKTTGDDCQCRCRYDYSAVYSSFFSLCFPSSSFVSNIYTVPHTTVFMKPTRYFFFRSGERINSNYR
jgi:hypothetical protein